MAEFSETPIEARLETVTRPETETQALVVCGHAYDMLGDFYAEMEEVVGDSVFAYLNPDQPNPLDRVKNEYQQLALLPPEFSDLERLYREAYEWQYQNNQGYTFPHAYSEAGFQQWAIAMDRITGRFGVNHVGLYVPTYVDGLSDVGAGLNNNRYLGGFVEHRGGQQRWQAVLLGCSSMSSSAEFQTMVKAMNPQAEALVLDIDPLALKMADHVGVNAQQMDVLADQGEGVGKYDLVATNFLMSGIETSLPHEEAWCKFLENAAKMLRLETGRLVLVEQIGDRELLKLVSILATDEVGLQFAGSQKYDEAVLWGRNRHPVRVAEAEYIPTAIGEDLRDFVTHPRAYAGELFSEHSHAVVVPEASALVFKMPAS